MNKKFKYTSLVAAGAVTLGLVGGTLAWFTSTASVTNPFATGITDNPNDPNSGIDINENFNPDNADNVIPGDDVTKKVQVTNKASYDQFVRAEILVEVTRNVSNTNPGEGGDKITSTTSTHKIIKKGSNYVVDGYEDIVLNFKTFGGLDVTTEGEGDNIVKTVVDAGKWYPLMTNVTEEKEEKEENEENEAIGFVDYFYYLGKVKADDTSKDSGLEQDLNYTNTLLESVELLSTAGNQYKNIEFDVIINADSIQATHDAYKDWCDDESLQAVYDVLQDGETTAPTDSYAVTK